MNFDELNIYEIASLLWKSKIEMDPIFITEDETQHFITGIEVIEAEIVITLKKVVKGDKTI